MSCKAIITVTALLLVGCTSYPRYRSNSPITPEEQNNSEELLTTEEYVEFGLILQSHLGRPYKGSSKTEEGLDCSMFTGEVYRKFNKTRLPRTAAEQYQAGLRVPANRLSYGDLVFFRTERDKISHVGIYIGDNKFIHASSSRGVIISGMREKYWVKRYAGARRVLE